MDWHFNNDMPIYTQLISQIKFGIVAGQLPPGARMTTVRELAAEAGVNPNTMQRALQELEREGLVYTQRSNGRFVTEDVSMIEGAKMTLAKQHIQEFLRSMEALGYKKEEIIALLAGEEEEKHDDSI